MTVTKNIFLLWLGIIFASNANSGLSYSFKARIVVWWKICVCDGGNYVAFLWHIQSTKGNQFPTEFVLKNLAS